MPTYQYKCNDCKKTFAVHLSVEEHEKNPKPPCTHCGGKKVERIYSGVAVVTSKKS
ncbi:MAG: hypothetical protein Kow0042_11210 [Calditrichia bacterium]